MSDFRTSKCAIANIYHIKGDSFYFNFIVKDINGNPVDLSVYDKAKMQVRENEFSEDALLTFTHTGATYNIDISNLEAGQIIVTCPILSLPALTYIHDLQLFNNNSIETIIRGNIYLEGEVTT
jgi:hypothetical protein